MVYINKTQCSKIILNCCYCIVCGEDDDGRSRNRNTVVISGSKW